MFISGTCLRILISASVLYGIILCTEGLVLPLPRDLEGVEIGEVTITLKEDGGRLRRSTDGVTVPAKKLDVTFPFHGKLVDLHLLRKDELSANVPVYTTNERGIITRQYIQDKNNVFFYQDESKFAAFYVETTDSALCMFGSFEAESHEYFLEPRERNCDERNSDTFKIFMAKQTNITYNDNLPIDMTRRQFKTSPQNSAMMEDLQRNKRAIPEYKIEMLLIIDFSVYNYWYTQSSKATSGEKDTEAKANIRQYYAWVINGMDVRYKNIQTSSYTITVVFAGIYIADDPTKSTFTENNKDSSTPTPKVVASTVLNDVTSWVQSTSGLPSHDHAMMFSRYDFTNSGSSSNAGLAWVSALCSTQSVSIVEDHFNFVIMTVAAHELGHSLGADHDGTGNACNGSYAFIMSATSVIVDNTNPWKFSSCSTNYFTTYINLLNSQNRNCMTSLSATFDPTALNQYTSLPGQVYDPDSICRHILGSASSFCKFPYNNNYTSICTTLWCTKPDGSGQCESAMGVDGTQCGNRKWCVSGVCTQDDCAPTGDDACLYGDRSGVVINFSGEEKTCADVANDSRICYNVADACCKTCSQFYTGRQDCEYGDKVTGCTSAYCPTYGETLCCGSCYTGTTVAPVTTTEAPNLCQTTTMQASTTTETQTTTELTTTTVPTTTTTTPTTTTTTPTTTTTAPTTTTTAPTTTTTAPTTTTTAPTTTTTAPTTTTTAPTTTTTTPTTTTTAPTTTTTAPTTTTTAPTTTTPAPTTTTTTHTTTTTTPTTTTTAPTTTTTAPTTTTTAPTTTTTAPTTTTTEPAITTRTEPTTTTEATTTTTEPTTTTTTPTTTTTEPTTTTTTPTTTTTKPTTTTTASATTTTTVPTTTTEATTTTTAETTTTTTTPTTTTTEPTTSTTESTTTTAEPTTTTAKPTTTTTTPTTTTTEPTTTTTEATTTTTEPTTTTTEPTTTTTEPTTTTTTPTTTTTEPTSTTAEPTTTTTTPTTTTTTPTTTTAEPTTTTAEPTTTTTTPTTTTAEPTTTTEETTTTTAEPTTTTAEQFESTTVEPTTEEQTTSSTYDQDTSSEKPTTTQVPDSSTTQTSTTMVMPESSTTTTQPTTTTTLPPTTTTLPTTTTTLSTTTNMPSTTEVTVPTTTETALVSNERLFVFVIRLVIVITEDLTITAQYSIVLIRAETALTELYRRRLGSRFKRCRVKRLRRGSLIVDYDVVTDDEASSTSDVVSVAKDLVSGTENVTYDGQSVPVSSAAFVDSSGTNVNISSSTTGCELLESSSPCGSGYQCVEGGTGPYCRKSNPDYEQQMLIIIGAVMGAFVLLVVTAVILVLCICTNQRKERGRKRYGIDNPGMIPDDFHHNGQLNHENDLSRSFNSSDINSPFYGRRWYPGYNEMAPYGTWQHQPMSNAKYSIPRPKY